MKKIYTLLFVCSSLILSAQCLDDTHSPFPQQGWLSCQQSQNPIVDRGVGHWLQYDFGEVYAITDLYLWNHNVWGETGYGVKEIMVDYSTDGNNWDAIGPFEIEEAPGSWKYQGQAGPDFGLIEARYVIITVMDTWDGANTCAGIAEVKFNLGEAVNTEDADLVDFEISPNPASTQITFDFSNYTLANGFIILNGMGQQISQHAFGGNGTFTLPLNDYRPGMYYISFNTETNAHTQPFVVID